ncbi:MAG TPA: DUF3060 domain-containing protein [Kofleriaceae bacterium]
MIKALVFVMLVGGVAAADKSLTKSGSHDCGTDPVVEITGGNGKYTLKGTCKEIMITGGHNTIAVESVGTLTVNGSSNTIAADNVDTANVSGSNNKVTWKKSGGAGGKPATSSLGQSNTFTQAK